MGIGELAMTAVIATAYIALIVLGIVVVVRLLRWLLMFPRPRSRDAPELRVLDERLRRGEISFAEYEIARRALGR